MPRGGRRRRQRSSLQDFLKNPLSCRGNRMRGPGPLYKRYEGPVYQFVELNGSFQVLINGLTFRIMHLDRSFGQVMRTTINPFFASIPCIMPFTVFWPPGNPMLPDKVKVPPKWGWNAHRGARRGQCTFAVFPAPGKTSFHNTGSYGAILFAHAFPARETAFEPEYRMQNIRKSGKLAECLIPPWSDRGIFVETTLFRFSGKHPCGGVERSAGRDAIGAICPAIGSKPVFSGGTSMRKGSPADYFLLRPFHLSRPDNRESPPDLDLTYSRQVRISFQYLVLLLQRHPRLP